MLESTGFTDEEIQLIQSKLNETFEKGMMFLLLVTPLICLIGPYIPGRRSEPLIDRMGFADAFLRFAIIWVLMILILWFWQVYKYRKEFAALRPFLKRKCYTSIIKRKSRSTLSMFDDKLITDLKGDLRYIRVTKAQSKSVDGGNLVLIELEERTKAVLKIEKLGSLPSANVELDLN